MFRARRRGQAVVEFGLIALLFVGLLFAVVDFGLLLNTWLAVSSGSREIARSASVGKREAFLRDQAEKMVLPSVSTNGFSGWCCDPDDALEVTVTYYDCSGASPCAMDAISSTNIHTEYWGGDPACTTFPPCFPKPDNRVTVTVKAHGAQVITPLIRPFFGCTDGTNPNCNVTLTSSTTMRYEGQVF